MALVGLVVALSAGRIANNKMRSVLEQQRQLMSICQPGSLWNDPAAYQREMQAIYPKTPQQIAEEEFMSWVECPELWR